MLKGKTGKHYFSLSYNPFKVECESDVIGEMISELTWECFHPVKLKNMECEVRNSEEEALLVLATLKAKGYPIEIISTDVRFEKTKNGTKN